MVLDERTYVVKKNFTRDLIRLRTIIIFNGDMLDVVGLLLAAVFGLWENNIWDKFMCNLLDLKVKLFDNDP